MYLNVVSCSSPIGPRACIFPVEIPIAAPNPNPPPSANCVDAFSSIIELFTWLKKYSAILSSSVMIASVCPVPYSLMCEIASSMPLTTFTDIIASRYSVAQSESDTFSVWGKISFIWER